MKTYRKAVGTTIIVSKDNLGNYIVL